MPQKHMKVLPAQIATLLALTATWCTGAPFAQAATLDTGQLSMKQALAQVRSEFAIPKSYELTQESYQNNTVSNGPQSTPTYSLSFQYPAGSATENYQGLPPITISVTINAKTGAVQNYYRSVPYTAAFTFPPAVSTSQAETIAKKWAQKLYPTEYASVRLQPSFYGVYQSTLTQPIGYSFTFERYVNGIAAPFDGFTIQVGQHGNLSGVNGNWTQGISFSAPSSALSMSKITNIYKAHMNLYLNYQPTWVAGINPLINLEYQQYIPVGVSSNWNLQFDPEAYQGAGFPVFDATTGLPLASDGKTLQLTKYPMPVIVSPGGPMSLTATKVNWTQSQAIANVEKMLHILSTYKVSSVSETQNMPQGDTIYDITWTLKGRGQFSASVDATTGTLNSFNAPIVDPLAYKKGITSPQFTAAQAFSTANNFVKQAFPHATGALGLVPQGPAYFQKKAPTSFEVVPIVHGVPYGNGIASINLDQRGQIQNYYYNPVDLSRLPNVSEAMSMGQALTEWAQHTPLKLSYLITQPSSSTSSPRVVLAYVPQGTMYGESLNAITHVFNTGMQNGTITPYSGSIKDLGDASGARQIKLLVRHVLVQVDSNGDVHPNRVMTRAEFVSLVASSLNFGGIIEPFSSAMKASMSGISSQSPAYPTIQSAYERGWVLPGKPFDPSAPATRDFAAQVLARALGYISLIEAPALIHLTTADANEIPSSHRAADAIALALGMLSPVSGNFDPNGQVTLNDAAIAVVKMAVAYSTDGSISSYGGGVA